MIFALDTNIVIRYLRKDNSVLRNFDTAVTRGDDLVIPKVVDYEIQRGFRIMSAPRKEVAYNVMTRQDGCCNIAEMDVYSWKIAEQVYADLYRKGFSVGELDILIAAFCLEKGYTLVTNNTKHFENIDGLNIEDWAAE